MKRLELVLVLLCLTGIHNVTNGQKYITIASHSTSVILNGIEDGLKSKIERNAELFIEAINQGYISQKNPAIESTIANNEAIIRIGDLWASSSFFSVSPNIIENVLNTPDGNYEVRNIQIVFEEASQGYEQQDAVLIIDKSGKIKDFKVALGYHSYSSILTSNTDVADIRRRQMIVNFVEDFRTSYNIKDIDFLNKVFSDKALIVTGKVIRESNKGELPSRIEYKKQTKQQYLANLKYLFDNAKMVSVKFDSIEVVKHPKYPEIYGVHLVQTWDSEKIKGGRYNDIGYVFLLIDFKNEDKPMIWVRTWSVDDLFSLDVIDIG